MDGFLGVHVFRSVGSDRFTTCVMASLTSPLYLTLILISLILAFMTEETQEPEPEEEETFFERDEEGRILEISMVTGIIVNQSKNAMDLLKQDSDHPLRIHKYTRGFGEVICALIAKGETFTSIVEMEGMPKAHVLARWRAEHEDFNIALGFARKMRAEHFHDMVVKDLQDVDGDENKIDKDEVAARKLKMDRLKWLSSVNDPDTYGTKTKVSGDTDAPLQIVVSTGIHREE